MIRMHDGKCRPFTIDRVKGRDVNGIAWDLQNGTLFRADAPLLGWRIAPFAYNDEGIRGVGQFRPSKPGETPFGTGINSLPPAVCHGRQMLLGRDRALLQGSVLMAPHASPHPRCTCGYRLVHDVKDIARFFHRHKQSLGFTYLEAGAKSSAAIFAVQGLGLTARSVEFKHFSDPHGTVRTQYVSMEAIVLLDRSDAHCAPLFEKLGFQVHVLEELTGAHEAGRCGSEYKVLRRKPTKKEHALRLSADPGRDGGTYFTRSGEWGLYGAAGVLLRTTEAEPRYLVQQRSYDVSYGGTWSIPGGAVHEKETPGETAARELSEEMGISDLTGLEPSAVVTLQSHDWVFHTIVAECSKRPRVTPNREVAKTAWLTRAEILDLAAGGKCHPLFEAALPKLLSNCL